jgi:isopenicillin-N epimerase
MLPMKQLFMLDPNVIYFNHGSFGATPYPVFESLQRWQRELEWQPSAFLGGRHHDLMLNARTVLADFLGTKPENLVFVTNATMGFNIIAHSLDLKPGDEVLTSDHEYGAMDRTFRYLAQKKGFTYVSHHISVPIKNAEDFVDDFWQGVTPQTRVIFLSHVTSPTAAIFPIKRIAHKAHQAGILTLIDGAHAPGQMDLNLDDLGADFYTGNLHKWVCAPKGSAFLYTRPEVQNLVEPLIVSFGWDGNSTPGPNRFVDLLEWTGTRDISPFLAAVDAIKFLNEHDWPQVRSYCHNLGAQIRHELFEMSHVPSLYPDTTEWYSQMGTASLPNDIDLNALGSLLHNEYHIVVPIMKWNDHNLIRFSIQAYNSQQEVDILLEAIKNFLGN